MEIEEIHNRYWLLECEKETRFRAEYARIPVAE